MVGTVRVLIVQMRNCRLGDTQENAQEHLAREWRQQNRVRDTVCLQSPSLSNSLGQKSLIDFPWLGTVLQVGQSGWNGALGAQAKPLKG